MFLHICGLSNLITILCYAELSLIILLRADQKHLVGDFEKNRAIKLKYTQIKNSKHGQQRFIRAILSPPNIKSYTVCPNVQLYCLGPNLLVRVLVALLILPSSSEKSFGIPPKLIRLLRMTMTNVICLSPIQLGAEMGHPRLEAGDFGFLTYADDIDTIGIRFSYVAEAYQLHGLLDRYKD